MSRQNMRDAARGPRTPKRSTIPEERYRMLCPSLRLRPIKFGATKPSKPTRLRNRPAIIVMFLIIIVFHTGARAADPYQTVLEKLVYSVEGAASLALIGPTRRRFRKI